MYPLLRYGYSSSSYIVLISIQQTSNRFFCSLLTSNHTQLTSKLLIYKLFIKLIWMYESNYQNLLKSQTEFAFNVFNSKTLRAKA